MTNDQQLSIAEAISRFVNHQKDSKQAMQGLYEPYELLRFQARIGKDKPITTLHAIDVEDYAKWTSENLENPASRLDLVKKFLTFANRRGWTEISLARYAAPPRRNRRRFQNADPSGTSYRAIRVRMSEERYEELQRLRDKALLIQEDIRVARSDGGVRKNAPLDAAWDQQRMVARRIRQLEYDLARVEIVDTSGAGYWAPTARLSEERHAELQAELQRLHDEVPLIREAIRVARSDGDVRENVPLDAALEQQRMVERRIRQLEHDLERVEIVDAASTDTELVSIGSRVTLHNLESDREMVFTLVDVREADVSAGKISTVSPIGQALMGRGAGDEVSIATPRGTVQYRIASIGG